MPVEQGGAPKPPLTLAEAQNLVEEELLGEGQREPMKSTSSPTPSASMQNQEAAEAAADKAQAEEPELDAEAMEGTLEGLQYGGEAGEAILGGALPGG
jgi:hypothetical protein